MKTVTAIARELVGLFVDDGSLAVSVLLLIALAALILEIWPDMPLAGGGLLLFGCLAILFANTSRASGR
jgi:hypothetical protein